MCAERSTQNLQDLEQENLRLRSEIVALQNDLEDQQRRWAAGEGPDRGEALFRAIYDQAPHLALVLDLDGVLRQVNRTALEFIGENPHRFIGRPFCETTLCTGSTDDREKLKEGLRRAGAGESVHFETSTADASGALRQMDFSLTPVRDDAGRPFCLLAEAWDITARKEAQEKLHHRARGQAALLDVSRTLAATLKLEEVLQAATDGVTHLFGLKTAAVYLGEGDTLRLWATTPPLPPQFPEELRLVMLADHPHVRQAVTFGEPVFLPDTATADLTPAEAAVTALRGLRSVLYLPLTAGVKCVGTLIVASVGEPVVISDAEIDSCRTLANLAALAVQNAQLYALGQQYAAELERRIAERERTERALRESEERLRLALMAAEQGLYDLNVQTGETIVTPEYARMLGYAPEEFTETNARWIERLHPDEREPVAEAYRQYVAGATSEYRVEFRQRTKTGDWKWILSIGRIVQYDASGQPLRMLGTHTDVTARKEAEEERGRLSAQLLHAQKMESVGRLAGGVAHDFNNMLLVILACLDLVKMRRREDAALLAEMAEIERAALRARDITRQLLAVSRKQIVTPRPLNLSDFLEGDTRKTLGRLIGEDVDLRFHLSGELWPVRIDPSQVDQVLMNLAVNARDAMPAGGKLTIETTNVRIDETYCRQHVGFRVGDYVLLAVSDSGVGMDRDTLSHVFEPFFTTKAMGKGTGLGLATVYGIVTQNGGVVSVYSEPGLGTAFKIYLPRLREVSSSAGSVEDALLARTGGTVLVVEDDEAVRRLTAAMLDALGFAVFVARGWREALALAGQPDASIDLLLTDVVMPELSGKELSERLRALRPGLAVLYMSGYTANVIAHHGILDTGVHFIQKPFTMDDLARGIQAALGGSSPAPASAPGRWGPR